MASDIWRPQRILRRTWKADQTKEYRVMEKNLSQEQNRQKQPPALRQQKASLKNNPIVDICGISAIAFKTNLKQEQNTYFTTSLYKIDRLLQESIERDESQLDASDRQADETELQWLKHLLPS
jgi:hypothetical protein